jgi:hypothetical protein
VAADPCRFPHENKNKNKNKNENPEQNPTATVTKRRFLGKAVSLAFAQAA